MLSHNDNVRKKLLGTGIQLASAVATLVIYHPHESRTVRISPVPNLDRVRLRVRVRARLRVLGY